MVRVRGARFGLAAAVALLAASQCARSARDDNVDADAGAPDDVTVLPPSDGTSCANNELSCSSDMQNVVDCDGNVVIACRPTEGCFAGKCIDACDAATANQSSVGCEYYALNPGANGSKGCFALFVVNTWSAPVS